MPEANPSVQSVIDGGIIAAQHAQEQQSLRMVSPDMTVTAFNAYGNEHTSPVASAVFLPGTTEDKTVTVVETAANNAHTLGDEEHHLPGKR